MNFLMFDKFLYGIYVDKIPFVLINSPGDSYNKLFNNCIRKLNFTNFECGNLINQLKAPCDEIPSLEEVTGNLNDLTNQKYFIVFKVVENFIHCHNVEKTFFANVNTNTAAMFISILPRRIDLPSEEAREVESRIMENAKQAVKNSLIQSILYEKLKNLEYSL